MLSVKGRPGGVNLRLSLVASAVKISFADEANARDRLIMHATDQVLEDARRAGIDLDLLDSNLALTYEERVLRHESALELVRALKEAHAANERSATATAAIG